jgi:proline dehydrogenase
MGLSAAANHAMRSAILAAADSPRVQRVVQKHGMRLGAGRFVAGETFDECLLVLRRLTERGFAANTTLLGEGVRDEAETRVVVSAYEDVIARLDGMRANVALKLTHLGLELDEELAYANVKQLLGHGSFIRIDMEQSQFVDATLRIYRRLRADGFENVGTVLQAYLFRSERDLAELLPLQPNLRIVKGAYLEPAEIAYADKADVDAAYVRMIETSLAGGGYTAVATHDERMIDAAIRFSDSHGIGRDRFQFQMLYGIRPQLQQDLLARGYSVLVATPYGPEWYPYLMRRLGERPANLLFFLKNLIRG